MSVILKNSDFFQSGELPLYLRYTESSGDLGFHSHEFTEIAIMFQGSAIYETDYSKEKISAGDVLIIPPGGLHRYCEEQDVKLMNILFHFKQLNMPDRTIRHHPGYVTLFGIDPNYCHRQKFYPEVHLPEEQLAVLKTILMSAYDLQAKNIPGAMLAVYGAFMQTIPMLLRNFAPDYHSHQIPLAETFRQTVNYMLANYQRELNIAALAKKAGMSQSTFTRTFKKTFGQTPLQYLLSMRLKTAREYLHNGCSVSEAAIRAGFKDSCYFTRIFKKNMSDLPRNWKKQ